MTEESLAWARVIKGKMDEINKLVFAIKRIRDLPNTLNQKTPLAVLTNNTNDSTLLIPTEFVDAKAILEAILEKASQNLATLKLEFEKL